MEPMNIDIPSGPARPQDDGDLGVSPRQRFVLELEFVQCLASPAYLNWLAQTRHLEDAAFLRFLDYLQYWKQPQYSKYIIYPQCLEMLDLLQTPEFRAAIANPNYKELVHTQQFYSWQHHKANRMKEAQARQAPAADAAPGGPPP